MTFLSTEGIDEGNRIVDEASMNIINCIRWLKEQGVVKSSPTKTLVNKALFDLSREGRLPPPDQLGFIIQKYGMLLDNIEYQEIIERNLKKVSTYIAEKVDEEVKNAVIRIVQGSPRYKNVQVLEFLQSLPLLFKDGSIEARIYRYIPSYARRKGATKCIYVYWAGAVVIEAGVGDAEPTCLKELLQQARSFRVVKVLKSLDQSPLGRRSESPITQVSIWAANMLDSWKRWARTFPEFPLEKVNVVRHTHFVARLAALAALIEERLEREIDWKLLAILGPLHEEGEILHEIERDLKTKEHKRAELNTVKELYRKVPEGQEIIRDIYLFENEENLARKPSKAELFTLYLLKMCDRLAALEELITNWGRIKEKDFAKEKLFSIFYQLSECHLVSIQIFVKDWVEQISKLIPDISTITSEVRKLLKRLKKEERIKKTEINENILPYFTAILEEKDLKLKEEDGYICLQIYRRRENASA